MRLSIHCAPSVHCFFFLKELVFFFDNHQMLVEKWNVQLEVVVMSVQTAELPCRHSSVASVGCFRFRFFASDSHALTGGLSTLPSALVYSAPTSLTILRRVRTGTWSLVHSWFRSLTGECSCCIVRLFFFKNYMFYLFSPLELVAHVLLEKRLLVHVITCNTRVGPVRDRVWSFGTFLLVRFCGEWRSKTR